MADRQALCLLSLDGGGIRGVCEILLIEWYKILKQIMFQVQKRLKLPVEPKPCDYFNLIGGTSTGGLIALMLGRFEMTATECLEQYTSLAKKVFGEIKLRSKIHLGPSERGMYRATTLEEVVKNLAHRQLGDKEANLLGKISTGRCFVTTLITTNVAIPVILRSYDSDVKQSIDCKIWEAARATTAAPKFFKPIKIKRSGGYETEFFDAGIRANNPLNQVLQEALLCFGSLRHVRCILSLGSGHPGNIGMSKKSWFPIDLVNTLKDLATDCIVVDDEHRRRYRDRDNFYFRFNLEHGAEDVSLEDWTSIDRLSGHVQAYMEDPTIEQRLNTIVDVLCATSALESSPTLAEINKVVSLPTYTVEPYEQNMPPKCPGFIARHDIYAKLQHYFNDRIGAAEAMGSPWLLLYGLPGSGKSQLCRQLFEDSRSSISARFWVDASSAETITQSYQEIAKKAGLKDNNDVVQAVCSWLAILSEKKVDWLLVLDNFDPSQNISNFLPGTGIDNGCVIVTCIKKLSGAYAPLEVGALSVADASKLLLHIANKQSISTDDEQMATEKLVTQLGCLPFAISVAAAHIASNQYSLVEYLERWELIYSRNTENTSGLPRSLSATIQISYDHLQSCDISGNAVRLLHFLAFVRSESASSVPLLRAFVSSKPTSNESTNKWSNKPLILSETATFYHGLNSEMLYEDKIRQSLSVLESLSLLHFDGLNHVQMSALIRHWIFYRLNEVDRRDWWCITASTLALSLSGTAHNNYRQSLLPHLHHLFDMRFSYLAELVFELHASDACEDFEAAFLFADVYAVSGYFETALVLRKGIWERTRRKWQSSHNTALQIKALYMLAVAYSDKGDFQKALEYQERATKFVADDASAELLSSDINLNLKLDQAQNLRRVGKANRSAAIIAHIKSVLEKSFHNTTDLMLRVLRVSKEHELGLFQRENNSDSLEKLSRIVTHHQSLVTEDDHELLIAQSELASCYSEAGYEQTAFQIRRHILALRRKESITHHDTLVAMGDFAQSLSRLGGKEEALKIRREVVEMLARSDVAIVESHPTFLAAKFNYARSLLDTGDFQKALKIHQEVLDLRKKSKSPKNLERDILDSIDEVAICLFRQARHDPNDDSSTECLAKVLRLHHETESITIRQISDTSVETYRSHLRARTSTALFLADLCVFNSAILERLCLPSNVTPSPGGVLKHAIIILKAILFDQCDVFGTSDLYALTTSYELGRALFNVAKYDDSSRKLEHYNAALNVFMRTHSHAPKGSPLYVRNLLDMIRTYKKLGRVGEAVKRLEELLAIQEERLGHDSGATITTARNLWAELKSRKDDPTSQDSAQRLKETYSL